MSKEDLRGKIIVVEGIDGSGKTTLTKSLALKIDKLGYEVFLPNSDPDFKPLRAAKDLFKEIIGPRKKELYVNDLQISLLALGDLFNIKKEIIKRLKSGHVCILDRYYFSTLTYGVRGYLKDDNLNAIKDLNLYLDIVESLDLEPACVFYINVTPELAYNNIKKRSSELNTMVNDVYENLDELKRISSNYNYIFNNINKYEDNVVVLPVAGAGDYETLLDAALNRLKIKFELKKENQDD